MGAFPRPGLVAARAPDRSLANFFRKGRGDPFRRTAKEHGGIRLPSTSPLVNTRGHEFCDFEPACGLTSSTTDHAQPADSAHEFEFAARGSPFDELFVSESVHSVPRPCP